MDELLKERIKALYGKMQEAYDQVAQGYGFGCEGCDENCCTQRFYHHTYAEYYYLLEGVREMGRTDPDRLEQIMNRAHVVVDTYLKELAIGEIMPLMCPVNFDGLCSLYEHRPMICRMHGLPHSFTKPDGSEVTGSGCHRFNEQHKEDARIDRTGLYTELAGIEKDLRLQMGLMQRYKKTTAEMLVDMAALLGAENEEE